MKKQADALGDAYEDYPEDEGRELSAAEVLKIAGEVKEFGNAAFKQGNLRGALAKYQKGLRYLNEHPELPSEESPDLSGPSTQLRFSLNSNSALLQVKLKAFQEAQHSADNALEVEAATDQDRAKASYRKALALLGLKDDEEAVKTLETAQKLAPNDAAISKELSAAKQKAAEQDKRDRAQYKKFFE